MDEQMKKMLEVLDQNQKEALETMPGFKEGSLDIRIFGSEKKDCPVIYTNTIPGEDMEFWKKAQKADLPDFIMVAVTDLNWGTDLAPWYCEPCGPSDTPCYGGAEDYLKVFTEKILPKAESMLSFHVEHRFLAGYSLAGLFAFWSLYHTDLFERLICGSGSFWYPKFQEYVEQHTMLKKPESIYFSLGREESHTIYEIFNSVQVRTEWLENWVKDLGIDTAFVLEPGNHYDDPPGRMVRGLEWTFRQIPSPHVSES